MSREHFIERAQHFRRPRAEREELGRAVRDVVPLEAHAELPAWDRRPDPIDALVEQDDDRLPELVPIRHGRMCATPFTFFRGAAAIMAADLSHTPTTSLHTQLCGDAHVSNFGVFLAPDRRLVFDVNDFDETLPGPFEWDVKRLAASVTVAGRDNDLERGDIRKATRAAVRRYREVMDRVADLGPLDLHHFRLEVDEQLVSGDKHLRKGIEKARAKNRLRAFEKLTEDVGGHRRIKADPPLVVPLESLLGGDPLERMEDFLVGYLDTLPANRREVLLRYHLVDVASKVVGIGSVGTRCLIGYAESSEGDPLFLQFKEATRSALEPHLGPSTFHQAGQRVVEGQRLLQATGDLFLGWSRYEHPDRGHVDYYIRQLWDGKGAVTVEELGRKQLRRYAELCGGALALAHARSGDPAVLAGYLGDEVTFDRALADFAEGYADINEADHGRHRAAVNSGRIDAEHDV